MEGSDHKADGLVDYWSFLAGNRPYRLLVIGEVINQLGGWANYIATMDLVERLGGGSAVLVSYVVVIRMLPSLFMFPVAGVVADRFNRVAVLVATNLFSAATVLFLPFVRSPSTLWLLFALLALLFCGSSFTDPARKALTPQLVPQHELHLAATLDAFTWSLMAAVGASAGGLMVSALGTTACFMIDASTYLAAAGCSALILRELPHATPGVVPSSPRPLQRQHRFDSASSQAGVFKLYEDAEDASKDLEAQQHSDSELHLGSSSQKRLASLHGGLQKHMDGDWQVGAAAAEAAEFCSGTAPGASLGSDGTHGRNLRAAAAAAAVQAEAPAAAGAWQQAVADLHEGWAYMVAPGNRDVAAFTLIKASGALIWGASDVLYVKFSDAPAFQVRDSAFTMGLIFGAMGIGAFLGPAIFNHFTPNLEPYLLRSCALATSSLAVGYVLMTAAGSIWVLLPSVTVRSLGSAALWIYSTLLLQFRVPNEIQGRVFALEMAFFVSTETASGLVGGVMFDDWHLGTRGVAVIMCCVAAACAVPWCVFAWIRWRHYTMAAGSGKEPVGTMAQYELVPQESTGAEAGSRGVKSAGEGVAADCH